MRIHRHTENLPAEARGSVVAVGNFDGVHRGHQAVIGEAVRRARALNAPAAVLTFEPHPRRFFQPDAPPFQLTRFRTKARVMGGLGIDRLFVLRFNRAMAEHSAEDFIERFLARDMGVRHVVIGYDFVFGKGRKGNPELLRSLLQARGVDVSIMAPVTASAATVESESEAAAFSSTGVRDALRSGDPEAASRLLGRPFEIEGRVQRGDARGRQLGFPTANLWLGDYLRPALGVYAVRVAVVRPGAGTALSDDVSWHDGVANLGLRPTFGGLAEPRLEVHLFDFENDLYSRRLRVALVGYLRPERKFDGLDSLKAQIGEDAAQARRLLAAPPQRRRVPPPLDAG